MTSGMLTNRLVSEAIVAAVAADDADRAPEAYRAAIEAVALALEISPPTALTR